MNSSFVLRDKSHFHQGPKMEAFGCRKTNNSKRWLKIVPTRIKQCMGGTERRKVNIFRKDSSTLWCFFSDKHPVTAICQAQLPGLNQEKEQQKCSSPETQSAHHMVVL
jgi:hypothetical protein